MAKTSHVEAAADGDDWLVVPCESHASVKVEPEDDGSVEETQTLNQGRLQTEPEPDNVAVQSFQPENRAFYQIGDEVMVGAVVAGKKYPEWRNACVTARGNAKANGSFQIELDTDGCLCWMDAQDELLCPKGTHKAINAGVKNVAAVLAAPPSLLPNYFELPDEPPRPPACSDEIESMSDMMHDMEVIDGDDCRDGDFSGGVDGQVPPTPSEMIPLPLELLEENSKDENWRFQLEIGELIDALDTDNVWYESRVVAMSSTLVKLHYRGWTSKWDEWVERTSTRIAPLHTKVRNWRAFKVYDEVLVGRNVPSKKYPEWRNAVVTVVAREVDGPLRIEVEIDGSKMWLDAQDELLCPPGTHKAVNASMLTPSSSLF
ncbi:hypothetical protein BBI17_008689 [Phytophthora kernoviae]|uniref:Tudor domain-containing protein n=2 Tax=Phytophthora kernoviae TaxID=325452 RepID=A0A421FC57_9STRA|nr:hypothetical protein G195_009692 [Phytophthora kernoviae 00238/432]KAG2517358.1 hypothetical protein JM18_007791 [Phytophthora kernoviae]RLN37334.1 hypothetical protein BBI17_008689 [Phytophthora kernoviae]